MDPETTQVVRIIYLLGVALLVAPAAFAAHRSGKIWLRNAAIWLAIGAGLVVLYTYFA
jgi:hypothetical protein